MDGKDSAAIFELEQQWPSRGCLEPRAVMVGRVVEADRGMIPPRSQIKVIVIRVLHEIALHVHAKLVPPSTRHVVEVVRSRLEHNLAQELEFLGNIRCHEK